LRVPCSGFGGVLRFAGVTATLKGIRQAVRFSDFSELRRQEAAEGFRERYAGSNAPFFRTGEAGAWMRVLTQVQAERIVAAHRDTMARFGYDVSLKPEAAFAATARAEFATAFHTVSDEPFR
jgi:hypothetical protein